MWNIDIFAESRLEISKRISGRWVSLEKLLPNLRDFRNGTKREREREGERTIQRTPQAYSRCRLVINVGIIVPKSSNVSQISHPRFRANIVIIGFAGDACNVI